MRGPLSIRTACCLAIGLAGAPAPAATVDPFATAPPAPTANPPPHEPSAPATAPAPATTATPPHAPPAEPAERRECALSLDAAPLLREAVSRGIQPKVVPGSACDINPADNEFFGRGGNVDCKLQFANARWLGEGMRFTAITGVGNFEARVSSSGIEVTIPADGGVRFRRVSVQASVKATAACPAPRPDKVLAD